MKLLPCRPVNGYRRYSTYSELPSNGVGISWIRLIKFNCIRKGGCAIALVSQFRNINAGTFEAVIINTINLKNGHIRVGIAIIDYINGNLGGDFIRIGMNHSSVIKSFTDCAVYIIHISSIQIYHLRAVGFDNTVKIVCGQNMPAVC